MDDVRTIMVDDWDEAEFREMQKRAAGSNLDPVTLLATDYLNHFNEIVMLLEMVVDMPEILEDAKEWQPKSYVEHFETSSIADRALAIEAYPKVPPEYRQPFEQTIDMINALIKTTVAKLDAAIAVGVDDRVRDIARRRSQDIQSLMDTASAIIHGSTETLAQSDIDALMDS